MLIIITTAICICGLDLIIKILLEFIVIIFLWKKGQINRQFYNNLDCLIWDKQDCFLQMENGQKHNITITEHLNLQKILFIYFQVDENRLFLDKILMILPCDNFHLLKVKLSLIAIKG
jgi:hypothetical protein